MPQETVELYDILLVRSTAKAYLIRLHEDSNLVYWIPISQVEYIEFGEDMKEEDGTQVKEIIRMTIPSWLAEKHGIG